MKPDDQHLRDALAKLSTPPPSEAAQEQARAQALKAWHESRQPVSRARDRAPRARGRWIWAGAAAAAAIILALVFLPNRNLAPELALAPGKESPLPMADAPEHLLDEMQKLFPGQVLAVVEQDHAVDLQLDESPTPVPTEQALQIELVRGTQRVEVLTYSGRSFSVKLDGRLTQFMPLLTGAGALIVVTGNQVISGHGQMDGYEVAGHRIMDNKS